MSLKVKDIAKMLNISPSTVSLVLNNKPGISDTTRQKIFSLVQELGYPNLIPKKKESNKNIGFIIFKKSGSIVSDTPFFSQLIEGIDLQSRNHGYKLMISYINESDNPALQFQTFSPDQCEGFIVLATEMDLHDFSFLQGVSLPYVILDSYFEQVNCDSIVINNVHGAFEATNYLTGLGHTSIGYLRSAFRINNFIERYDGFCKALKYNGIPKNENFIFELGTSLESSYEAMNVHLKNNIFNLPTAFFADNDFIALGAMKALSEHGYKIPEDISIVGFDNIPFCEMIEPHLTTVNVPKQRLGMLAVNRLIEKLNEKTNEFIKIEIGTSMIERDSVKSFNRAPTVTQ